MAVNVTYDVGDVVPVTAEFTVGGIFTDPTTVTLKIRRPSGVIDTKVYGVDAGVIRDSAGKFRYDIAVDEPGIWHYRWVGTGPAAAAHESRLVVVLSRFSPTGLSPRALCALDDVLVYDDPNDVTDDTKDALFTRLINAASREMHREARREFIAKNATRDANGLVVIDAETRYFDARDVNQDRELELGDLATFTSATVNGTPIAAGDLVALPRIREEWEPLTRLRLEKVTLNRDAVIGVTGVWGFPQIPEDVRQKVIETVKFWADRDLSTFNETFSVETGGVSRARSLPFPAWETAQKYRKRRGLTSLQFANR